MHYDAMVKYSNERAEFAIEYENLFHFTFVSDYLIQTLQNITYCGKK